jgi:hypothetical protein
MGSLFAAAISAAVFLALLGIKQRYRADRR